MLACVTAGLVAPGVDKEFGSAGPSALAFEICDIRTMATMRIIFIDTFNSDPFLATFERYFLTLSVSCYIVEE
jgi:hypothetical protein